MERLDRPERRRWSRGWPLSPFLLGPHLLRPHLSGLLLLGLLLLGLLLTACGGRPVAEQFALEPIEHPDLAAIESVARQQLEEQRQGLEDQQATATEGLQLADAYGSLGELYHTYELFEPAMACYRNAMLLDPESFVWPYYLGMIHQRLGDYAAAADAFEAALEQRPEDPAARLHMAEIRRALGTGDKAAELWREMIEVPDYGAAAHFALGLMASEEGDWQATVDHMTTVLEQQPRATSAHHTLAQAYRQLDRQDMAAEHQDLAGTAEVTYPDPLMERLESLAVTSGAYLRRGNRALARQDLDAAIEAFRRAVDINPELVEAQRNLALAHVQRKDLDAALEVLREAVQHHGEDPWLQFDLGTTYLAQGLHAQAVEAFEAVVAIDPELSQAHFNLANALIARDRWAEAQSHLAKVLEKDPEHVRARYLQAMSHHHTGDSPQAVSALRRELTATPESLLMRQGLAQILMEQGKRSEARQVYAEGVGLDSLPVDDRLPLLFQMAELDWKAGRRAQAIEVWRRAVRLAPDSSEARTALGNGLQLLNQWPEARTHFAKAVAIDPLNAKAWRAETNLWILDKEFETARQRLDEALKVLPDDPTLLNTAARLMSTCEIASVRDGERALEMARKAYNIESSLDHAETIGMALAETGEFEKAIQWQRRLLAQVSNSQDRRLLRRLATNLQLYENRRPIRTG